MEQVHVFLRAKALAQLHTFNVPDAFAVLYACGDSGALTKSGATELLRDQRNPEWATVFTLEYLFETVQEFVVRVFQEEGGRPLADEARHSLVGETRFRLADVLCAPAQKQELALLHAHLGNAGVLEVRAEPRASTRDLFVATFSGAQLSTGGGFFSSLFHHTDPYFVISRCNEDGTYSVVWRSEHVANTRSPTWARVKIPLATLCNCDVDRPLRIEIFDLEQNRAHRLIGTVNTSVRATIALNGAPMNVMRPAAASASASASAKKRGTLRIADALIEEHATFTDYVARGLEISLAVAIDFTSSNGDPKSPKSLHYLDPTGFHLTNYEAALLAIGSIVEVYDTDKKFPVFGFGAKCRQPNGDLSPVQHCFPIYGGGAEVDGLQGIVQAYRDAVPNVVFSGPTLFAPLIHSTIARVALAENKYTILLILTDGVINDLEATKAAIGDASAHPLSIIIVGIGAADFTDMNALDGDGALLRRGTRCALRDIVQFVPYRVAAAGGPSVLAQQVLAELPTQVITYGELHPPYPLRS